MHDPWYLMRTGICRAVVSDDLQGHGDGIVEKQDWRAWMPALVSNDRLGSSFSENEIPRFNCVDDAVTPIETFGGLRSTRTCSIHAVFEESKSIGWD